MSDKWLSYGRMTIGENDIPVICDDSLPDDVLFTLGEIAIKERNPTWWERIKCWFGYHTYSWRVDGCLFCDKGVK